MRFMLVVICVGLAFIMSTAEPSWAQDAKSIEAATALKPATERTRLRVQLQQASDQYKLKLEQLLVLYEADANRAEELLAKMKELLAQGLVTRTDVKKSEDTAAQMQNKVADAREQLKSGDMLIADAFVEAETEESPQKVRPGSPSCCTNELTHTTAYIRYGGVRAWSLSEADTVKQFFMRRFGRALPVGAFGQSLLHNRWGYDHRNAMDVGISPDSNEGQILMDYLRANGIPFTAFHFAVPGKATGPHIHIGLPSHRITPMSLATTSGQLIMSVRNGVL